MGRPKVHDEQLAQQLLDEAARQISAGGPASMSVRGLATAVGTSTTAIYSLFGGRDGLLRALFRQTFTSFGASQQLEIAGDPATELRELGRGYRRWALQHPHLFPLLFDRVVGGTEPEDAELADRTREPLLAAVGRAQRAGVLDPAVEADLVAWGLWSQVHGLVSLELAGMDGPLEERTPESAARAEERFLRCLDAVQRGWAPASRGSR